MRRLVTFPRGTAEGLLVLEIPGDKPRESVDLVHLGLQGQPGIWAVWLERPDWRDPGMVELVDACGQTPIVSIRLLDEQTDWPRVDVNWLLDASTTVRACESEADLARRLSEAPHHPPIQDLIVELEVEQLPPSHAMLSMLVSALAPSCAYLYVPRDYLYRGLLVQNVGLCAASSWAVRWIP